MRNRAHRTHTRIARGARLAVVAGLSATLLLGNGPAALAASASTRADLTRLTEQVQGAATAYSEAASKAAELDGKVSAMADEALRLEQEVLPAHRERAAEAAANLYKQQSSNVNLLSMLMNASSFSDVIEMTKYLSTVQDANVRALNDLKSAHDELSRKMGDISRAKDAAVEQQKRAEDALSRAKDAQGKIAAKAASEDAQEAAAAKAAAEKARRAQEQIEHAQAQAQAQQQANKPADSAPTPQGQSPAPTPAPAPKPEPQKPAPAPQPSEPSGPTGNESGWKSGVASVYGIGDGFMGGTTASGEIVTETSMGIAMLNVPFGTRVEISYGGRSVIAYVNDRGPYVHGRVIDMQPAVARALDFVNVGVGTVQYRFL